MQGVGLYQNLPILLQKGRRHCLPWNACLRPLCHLKGRSKLNMYVFQMSNMKVDGCWLIKE